MTHLSDRLIQNLLKKPPETGYRLVADKKLPGFAARITAGGHVAFTFSYRPKGSDRQRRITIGTYGPFPDWTLVRARKEAESLRGIVNRGGDPAREAEKQRTVADLAQEFEEQYLDKLRPRTAKGYKDQLRLYVLPKLGKKEVAAVEFTDVQKLHRSITKDRGSPYQANRVVALLNRLFNVAVQWRWIERNPAKGIERNAEQKRTRYLNPDELVSLSAALAAHEDQQAADIMRLLLLTGARRGETQAARWRDLDLSTGIWTKPGSTTKQKTEHRVPLSPAAVQLLQELKAKAADGAEFVFPSHGATGHRIELKDDWAMVSKAAGITGARLHDLRHTFASILASAGQSLPIIGALLGHTQASTTQRYSHLFDDALRHATTRVADIITGKPSAEIVQLGKRAG